MVKPRLLAPGCIPGVAYWYGGAPMFRLRRFYVELRYMWDFQRPI